MANEIFDRTAEAAKAPVKKAVSGQRVGMGWTSPEVTTSTWDGLWEALIFKARNPEKFKMDVSNVVVADRPGYLARSMTINSSGASVQEHIYASERKGEIMYRIVDPVTKRETDDERVIAVKEGPLRMEFFHRHVSDGYRTYWQAPLGSVKQMVQELVDYAAKTEGKGGVVGRGTRLPLALHDGVHPRACPLLRLLRCLHQGVQGLCAEDDHSQRRDLPRKHLLRRAVLRDRLPQALQRLRDRHRACRRPAHAPPAD